MSQQQELEAIQARFQEIGDARIRNKIYGGIDNFKQNVFKPSDTIQVGDKLPDFSFTNQDGESVSTKDLLSSGHLLITFYRGSWCPYCNVAVQYLQRHLDDFKARGVTLAAITPELPDYTTSMIEKNELKFPVLTDLHNEFAKKLGLLFDQSDARELHDKLGVDLKVRNGEDTWEVPIPATLLVDSTGTVRASYIEPNFVKRLDPKVALEWIDTMLNEDARK